MNEILEIIKKQALHENIKITRHAHFEMGEDAFSIDDVLYAISNSEIIENYPDHKRGKCCLLFGTTAKNRNIHIVCTTGLDILIIITVYEPKPPKWITPNRRNKK